MISGWAAARPPPGPPQTVALLAMEREVDAFLTRGRGFQASVNGLAARQHARQQAALRQDFQRQIDAERRAEAAARGEAIRVFERFLRTHPEDRARTPDVMFRLAELYYDAATQARLDADEAQDRARAERQAQGQPAEDLAPAAPDHRCALHLYRHLLARFDDHRLRDATHYLLGWTLREMGREDEATSALLGLVCPTQHRYSPRAEATDATPPAMCAGLLAALPATPARAAAVTAATTEQAPSEGPLPNGMTVPIPTTYARCEPLRGADGGPSRYAAEAWYYVGEHHFDRAHDDGGNALAIAAYQEALRLGDPDGRATSDSARRFWALSLYKIGWARFRMQNGYPEALRQFSRLLDHDDRVGPASAAQGLRADALRWLGVILAEGDWGTVPGDEGQRCQRLVESLAHPPADAVRPFDCAGLLRVSAAQGGLIPQDRRWTPDAYLELADGYFQQTKYFEAVAVYELFLQRNPLHVRAPAAAARIAVAFERQRRFDQAADARRRLARYAEGGEWHDANRGHPGAQREAAAMARNALRDNAIRLHQEAAALRARAVGLRVADPARAAETLRQADARYALAAGAYVDFLRAHPHDDDAYEARFNRADALFWSRAYRDAARAYAEVVASNESDRLLAPAAYMAVRASESHVRALARRREIPACDALRAGVPERELVDDAGSSLLTAPAQAACGDADSPLALPEAVRELQRAWMDYLARVPARLDDAASLSEVVPEDAAPGNAPPFGPKFSYLHARTLLRYGHAQEAEAQYLRIVQGHCDDPVVGRAALDDLRAIYTRRRDLDALERLTRAPSLRGCEALRVAGMDLAFQQGARAFASAMEAPAAESAARFEHAAGVLASALAAHPTHREAPLAWIYLGRAHERSGRSAAAAQAYLRVVEGFDHDRDPEGRALDAAEARRRVNLLDEASLRAAQNLERLFDFEGPFATTVPCSTTRAAPPPRTTPPVATTPSRPSPSCRPTWSAGTTPSRPGRPFSPRRRMRASAPRPRSASRACAARASMGGRADLPAGLSPGHPGDALDRRGSGARAARGGHRAAAPRARRSATTGAARDGGGVPRVGRGARLSRRGPRRRGAL
ncbi:MAG: tetratricopeptide repeat protein [Polyangiales bacterium]